MKSLDTFGPFRKNTFPVWPAGEVMRFTPRASTRSFFSPSDRRTARERLVKTELMLSRMLDPRAEHARIAPGGEVEATDQGGVSVCRRHSRRCARMRVSRMCHLLSLYFDTRRNVVERAGARLKS
jgi:hypothetical protein